MSVLFAATYPERTPRSSRSGSSRSASGPTTTRGRRRRRSERKPSRSSSKTGAGAWTASDLAEVTPAKAFSSGCSAMRRSASPGAAAALLRMNTQIDVREVLPTIRCRRSSSTGRTTATRTSRRAGGSRRRFPARGSWSSGPGSPPWVGDADPVLDEIEEFLTGVRRGPDPDRVLATVLFTDIVGSTEQRGRARRPRLARRSSTSTTDWSGASSTGSGAGDRHGRRRLPGHLRRARAGGPVRGRGRATRSAASGSSCGRASTRARSSSRRQGRGIAVHIGPADRCGGGPGRGARLSETVKDLVAGSGIQFEDRGEHELKGIRGAEAPLRGGRLTVESMRDALIIDAVRSPIGKRNGTLASVRADELAAQVLNGLVSRVDVDPGAIEDVQMGCVTQIGEQALNVGRVASLIAGWPETVCATTVDRQCGSSMQAAMNAASAIQAGHLDLVVAAGIETMSRVPMGSNLGEAGWSGFSDKLLDQWQIVPQGISAEVIAEEWGLSREELDAYSLRVAHAGRPRDRRGPLRARDRPDRGLQSARRGPLRGRRDAAPRDDAREDGDAAARVQGGRRRHGRELERDRGRLGGDARRERGARLRARARAARPLRLVRARRRRPVPDAARQPRRPASARSRRRAWAGTTWP